MITYKLRIDDWLFDSMKNFELTIQDSCSRVIKKLKKDQIDLNNKQLPEEGKLNNIITIKSQLNVNLMDLRKALRIVFYNINKKPEPKIELEDIKYKNIVVNSLKE